MNVLCRIVKLDQFQDSMHLNEKINTLKENFVVASTNICRNDTVLEAFYYVAHDPEPLQGT